jgi:hypothetical protein
MSKYDSKIGSTDVIFQSISIFVEGVQVPFEAASISSSMGSLPSATIQIPIQAGLMDISRYYQPKVHIFYRDIFTDQDCLLFAGAIESTSYTKSVRGSGSASLVFNCGHKYAALNDLTLDFTGYSGDTTGSILAADTGAPVAKMNTFGSEESILLSMSGITKIDPPTEVSKATLAKGTIVDSDPSVLRTQWAPYKTRLEGMPGIMMNFWNQLVKMGLSDIPRYDSLNKLYVPLVENGLHLFERMGGHYYIEHLVEIGKADPCPGTTTKDDSNKKIVPPSVRVFLKSAMQIDMSLQLIKDGLAQFTGEFTSLMGIFTEFLTSFDYDLLVLSSPAEVAIDPSDASPVPATYALDVIAKPQLPFYYSPACNVVLPNMYTDLSVNQNDAAIPTRISVTQDLIPGTTKMGKNYRAPTSIRSAISQGSKDSGGTYDLNASTTGFFGRIGIYEQGRGIKHRRLMMPNWLAYYAEDQAKATSSDTSPPDPGSQDATWLDIIVAAWNERYTADQVAMNPWSPRDSKISAFESILFATAEYKYTMEVASSKAGSVSCMFNPYIISGYPMDIIAASPVEPSFHAMCTSVTHSITSRSIGTSVGFVSAITYTELANYYLQFIHPWLQAALGIINQDETGTYHSSILDNAYAVEIANKFYSPTLGVSARAPEDLINFTNGHLKPIGVKTGASKKSATGAEINPNLTAVGNLSFAYRPIETRTLIEKRLGIKFIDMTPGNYNPTTVEYTDSTLQDTAKLEPGESQFLTYAPVPK